MAFPPPPGFLQNFAAMASLMQMNQGQFALHPPMGQMPGLVPLGGGLLPPTPVGITVPTGVASISAAPIRNMNTEPFQGLPPPISQPLLQTPITTTSTKAPSGPSVTLFIGSITDRASDMLIRQILSKCGIVNIWKRVQGTNGKLQSFGFCDYGDPESAMRAIRILHDFEIGDKKLVVKADAKAQDMLSDYVKKKNPDATADKDVLDEQTKNEDNKIKEDILNLLKENEVDLGKDPTSLTAGRRPKTSVDNGKDDLDSMELEEDKRIIVNREIDRFRDTYKEDEPDKNDVRKEADKKRDRKERTPPDRLRDRNRRRDPTRDRRDRRDEPRREFLEKEPPNDDEDSYERKRFLRQMREKESSYQTRLRSWEKREYRKGREYEDYIRHEEDKKDEEVREIRKLKIFLEDYDDDRDDQKYYRSSLLRNRLRERQKEIDEDERDRRLERKEWEELKRKLTDEGHPDPESELAKRMHDTDDPEPVQMAKAGEEKPSTVEVKPREEIHLLNPFTLQVKKSSNELASSPSEKAKRSIPDIFGHEEDDVSQKKRRLPMLNDDDDDSNSNSKLISSDDKKRQIKELINEIPTRKEEVFKYPLEWSLIDSNFMEKRIRPWVSKKIVEFIGEEEKALVEFICNLVETKSTAEAIMKEISMVLEEEAEEFVVKLWRLIIYESKAKTLGLAKW